jgi:hypothetical protein
VFLVVFFIVNFLIEIFLVNVLFFMCVILVVVLRIFFEMNLRILQFIHLCLESFVSNFFGEKFFIL